MPLLSTYDGAYDAVVGAVLLGSPRRKPRLACNVDENGGDATRDATGAGAAAGLATIPDDWVYKTLDVCAEGDAVCNVAQYAKYPAGTEAASGPGTGTDKPGKRRLSRNTARDEPDYSADAGKPMKYGDMQSVQDLGAQFILSALGGDATPNDKSADRPPDKSVDTSKSAKGTTHLTPEDPKPLA